MQDMTNLPNSIDDGGGIFIGQDGNPVTGANGTQFKSQFINDLMKNILYVITQAGTGLTDDDQTDLYDALEALYAGTTEFLVEHNANGTHNDITADSIVLSATSNWISHSPTAKFLGFTGDHIIPGNSGDFADAPEGLAIIRPQLANGTVYGGRIPLNLPDGAEIDALTVYGTTGASDGDLTVELYRIPFATGTSVAVGSTIVVNGGASSGSDTSIGHTVDNSLNGYGINCSVNASVSVANASIHGARLTILTSDLKQT